MARGPRLLECSGGCTTTHSGEETDTDPMKKQVIGSVPYLNAKPLVFGMAEIAPWAEVVFDTPRRLVPALGDGSISVGLTPVMAYPILGQGRIVPEICISSEGEVQSVLLAAHRPFSKIRRLALDTSSMSSVALAQVLCREKYGFAPEIVDSVPGVSAAELDADGLVVIGDPAMQQDFSDYPRIYDLGVEWTEFTSLPFVYAFWLSLADEVDPQLCSALRESKARGLRSIETIAATESRRLGLPAELCHDYLADRIRYDLGEREIAGLTLFYDLCARHDLCPPAPPLAFA